VLLASTGAIPPSAALLRTYAPRVLVVWGPGIAALILARLARADGAAALLRRVRPSLADAQVAVAILLAGGAAATVAVCISGVALPELWRVIQPNAGLLIAHLALQAAVVATGEELGWRGWLLPQFLARTTRLRAALSTGVIWGLWHAPVILSGGATAIMFLVFVLGVSVLLTWLSVQTRSLFTVIVAHASVNAPMFFWEQVSGASLASDERLRRAWMALQVMYAVTGGVLVLVRYRWWTAARTSAASSPSAFIDPFAA
jgi:CAAX protease family protein